MIRSRYALLSAAILAAAAPAFAAPWTFGVISDTQNTMNGGGTPSGLNSVSTHIIGAINLEFVAKGVSFVAQPGDLGDNGSTASLQTRLDANSALTAAGIPFYGLRGNHEDNSACQTFFNANYIPASTSTAVVAQQASTSNYTVTYNGTKIVLLDILTADSTTSMASATTWMSGQLSATDHTQAFVFQHKNLLGQNHKDNAFGSGNDSNPTQQNAFFAALATNNVKYDISGHDHMNHRSIVTSPDGQNKVQEIISASDSTKFYTASSGFSSREQTVSDQQNKIGYYLYKVDGPRVTGQYYTTDKSSTTSGADGDITTDAITGRAAWTLQDTFGYSLNGKQFTVGSGSSYSGVTDSISAGTSSYGETFRGTSMSLSGFNTNTATAEGNRACADDVNTGWTPVTVGWASDVLTLWGLANNLGSPTTDPYSLTMSYDTSTAVFPTIKHQNDDGSWTELATINNGDGTVTASGVTFAGNFAVAVPEPASLGLLGLGALALLSRRRRA